MPGAIGCKLCLTPCVTCRKTPMIQQERYSYLLRSSSGKALDVVIPVAANVANILAKLHAPCTRLPCNYQQLSSHIS